MKLVVERYTLGYMVCRTIIPSIDALHKYLAECPHDEIGAIMALLLAHGQGHKVFSPTPDVEYVAHFRKD